MLLMTNHISGLRPQKNGHGGWNNEHQWKGEDLVELGIYDIRFTLGGDSDVKKSSSGSPITTLSQQAAKSAAKAANASSTPSIVVDPGDLPEGAPEATSPKSASEYALTTRR
jgi:hypothetical protein